MNWSYVAGFFDGEGNIHLKNNNDHKSYSLFCRFYSSNREVLLEIQKFIGCGHVYQSKRGLYELTFTKKGEVFNFLISIYPHSIIKKDLIRFLLMNYGFEWGNTNSHIDKNEFYSFINRENVEKSRTAPPLRI